MMPFIIWFIIIVVVIITVSKSTKSKKQKQKRIINQPANGIYEQRNHINETKARLQEKYGTAGRDSGILARANANVYKTDADHLGTVQNANDPAYIAHEQMHGRTPEFVNAAEYAPEDSILGSVSDLMAKGYSGKLTFERDFVGEAMDMLAECLKMPETDLP